MFTVEQRDALREDVRVAEFGQYVVVAKVGEAGEIAKKLDPRADG